MKACHSGPDEEQIPFLHIDWHHAGLVTYEVNILQDAVLPSCSAVFCKQSIGPSIDSCDDVMFLCILCVCWQNYLQHISEKMQFPGFLFHQVVQKH